ncbi:adenosine deaminase [Pleomorphomonas sp. JP5]|uniref:adenosine deaminase n=1 Tax=Pleomorphomonas sp. JP5 TaxID=2942998 RepID=UPI00204400B6|nr:adenosine deaminase [Pleomorphomonas sp. JP5]MCM5557448.1 adenosine deaminase [Pleomorphomonas sp. JP5]
MLVDVTAAPTFTSRPKVELHVHLDCSLTRRALNRLGNPIGEAEFRRLYTAPERCDNLMDYLRAIGPSAAALQTAPALAIATDEMMRALAADGVIHAEIRFAPHTHQRGGLSLDQVMAAVTEGLAAGAEATGITAGLILCALRDYPPEANLTVIELAHRWRDRGVVGVDLAGDEAGHPAAANRAVFDRAHVLGLPVTAHAGEAAGPDSLAEVMALLAPARIGHGVRAIESEDLLAEIKARNLHLEVCPSSNIQVGVYSDYADHPIDRMSRRGLSLSINTDARTVAPLSLSLEYRRLAVAFGWQTGEFLAHNLEALRHAFWPEAAKPALGGRLVEGWSG